LHRDLIRLRQNDPRFRDIIPNGVDGAVLGRRSFVLRYFAQKPEEERLLLVNLAEQHVFSPAPEPLLAPPHQHEWQTLWTSESADYGGLGPRRVVNDAGWVNFAEETVALRAVPLTRPRKQPKAR
jgi:maltooligosyltrehalose trehalohydrolase